MAQEQRQRQANAYNALQLLVHRHFSKANLTKKINEIFGTKGIEIDWHCYEDGELSDHNAMFSFTNDQAHDDELCGDFDIYYLECKTPNQWGDEVYVTEVGTDFFNH